MANDGQYHLVVYDRDPLELVHSRVVSPWAVGAAIGSWHNVKDHTKITADRIAKVQWTQLIDGEQQ